jgi:hypothetical protein
VSKRPKKNNDVQDVTIDRKGKQNPNQDGNQRLNNKVYEGELFKTYRKNKIRFRHASNGNREAA